MGRRGLREHSCTVTALRLDWANGRKGMTGLSSGRDIRVDSWLPLVILLSLVAQPASASHTGITGRSGKQGVTCNDCHSGGTPPIVEFQGPAQVLAGQPAMFRFLVRSEAPAQTFAGFNVAASAGGLDIASGQGGRLFSGELTHDAPKANDGNGEAAWEFTWRAPGTPAEYTLFGAGNSVNHNGLSTGDRAAATTLTVMVVSQEATLTPTATPTPTPTRTNPMVTRSPTQLGGRCVGDCDVSLKVSVSELILGVNIALGNALLDECSAVDANHNERVTINELIAAVNSALNGCP